MFLGLMNYDDSKLNIYFFEKRMIIWKKINTGKIPELDRVLLKMVSVKTIEPTHWKTSSVCVGSFPSYPFNKKGRYG